VPGPYPASTRLRKGDLRRHDFSGAFLLFQLQPMIAKLILPWFGAGRSLDSMLFFQPPCWPDMLRALDGQANQPRCCLPAHRLLAASLFLLPVILLRMEAGGNANPLPQILGLLACDDRRPLHTAFDHQSFGAGVYSRRNGD